MTDDPVTEDRPARRSSLGRALAWITAPGDEWSIGPTVPARMRLLWGTLTLSLLVTIVVLLVSYGGDILEELRLIRRLTGR